MKRRLEEITITSALENPEIRAILQAYHRAEVQRVDVEIYLPMVLENPAFAIARQKALSAPCLADRIIRIKKHIKKAGKPKKLSECAASLLEKLEPYQRELFKNVEFLQKTLEELEPTVNLVEELQVKFARAVKKVANSKCVSYQMVIQHQPYTDEAFRIAIPSRADADMYLKMADEVAENFLKKGHALVSSLVEMIKQTRPAFVEKKQASLNSGLAEILRKKLSEYSERRLNRLYPAQAFN